jgi:hypothetical protein
MKFDKNPNVTRMDVEMCISGNIIVSSLPEAELSLMSRHSEMIFIPRGTNLYRTHDHSRWVYFPTSALMAVMGETNSGESVELGLVGKEGMIGL